MRISSLSMSRTVIPLFSAERATAFASLASLTWYVNVCFPIGTLPPLSKRTSNPPVFSVIVSSIANGVCPFATRCLFACAV